MEINVSYDDSENDPLDVNTDGTLKSCIDTLLFKLSNSFDLPFDQTELGFVRSFDATTSRRTYTFPIQDINANFIRLQTEENGNINYVGYYVIEF